MIDLGEGNDFVDSGAGDDTITNDGGDNTVIAGDGDDSVTLGDGNNTVGTGAGDDSITLGNGNNLVAAGEGDNSVAAGDGDNSITAGSGRDIIELGDGDNTVDAGEGNNDLTAGDGNNTVTTGAGIDILALGDGDNTVDAGDGDNTVTVGTGSNSVTTGAGADTVTVLAAEVGVAPAGGNLIKVGAGDDVVTASGGDDVIFGGFGVDVLSGGAGADSFHYAERDESYSIYQDRITDFESGIDQIVIEENLLTQMEVEAGITLSGVDFVGTVANFGDAELAISTLPRLGNGVAEAVFQQDTGMFWVDLNDDGELDGRDLRVEVDFADGTLGSMSAGDVALLDTLAPAQALGIDLHAADDSGVSDTDNLTNADPTSIDVSFEVAATDGSAALEGDLVKLYVDGAEVDVITLTAGHIADGYVTFTGTLAEGQNNLAAEIIDQTGNSLGVSDTLLTVTIDRTAPDLPIIDTVAGDDIVNAAEETDLVISGTGEAGVAVAVSGDSGFSAGTTVDEEGNWSVTVSDASDTFGEGAETLSVTFTDDAGNVSATETRAITVDTIAPTIAIDTPIEGDDIVNAAEDGNVSISGTTTGVEDGQTVTVTFTDESGAQVTDTATVSGNTWQFTDEVAFTFDNLSGTGVFNVNTFAPGGAGYGIYLTVTDGVITGLSSSFAPTLAGAGDWDVTINGNVVTLSAQTEEGQNIVDGFIGATTDASDLTVGTLLGFEAFVEEGGNGIDISGLDNGDIEVTVDVSDFAGNPAAQASTTVELDNIAPDAPSITHFADDTGASDSDGITNDEIITLYGVGEPGATIEIFDNGESVGTTLVEEDGGWGFTTASLSDGRHNFTATATDVAGNTSEANGIEQFYAVDADAILPNSGTFTWTGPVEPTGTAVIYDTEPGIEGQTLDDDSDGDETATADVTLGALVSIGSDVDAEESWLVRDLSTGEEFVIVSFDVEDGPASGDYTLSEIPLDPNTTYEILEYSSNPNVLNGEPAYTYQGGTPVIIDTVAPTVDVVTVDDTMLSESDVGTSALKVTIDFDEAMDTNIDPTLTLSGEDGTETAAINGALTLDASLSGWIDSDTYEAYYDLTDTNLEADDIDIEVTLAEDVAGNVQNSHDELNEFSIDTVADLNAVDLLAASDTGLSGEDDITYETNPTFRIDFNDGVRAGDSIELLLDGASFSTAVTGTVDATDVSNGYIDLIVTGEDLGADGDKSITAKVTDLAGNTDTTDALTIHLDTLATIGAVDLVSGSDTGSSDSDDNSYVTDPTFQVALGADAEVGDSVELLLGGAAFANPVTKTLNQTDIDNGNVNLQVTAGDLGADGDKSITAKFTDVAGNTATSAALTYTLDTTAPAPTITSIVYDNELDTLVINGSSLNDVTFDATKMTWDIQGTSATDFTFEDTDLVGEPTVTGSQISMQLTAEASDALEGLAGFAGSVEDNFDFAGAAWTDTAGNISAAIDDQTITLNLLGTDNDDVIYGGSAGDTLEGGLGADTLIGRVGNDTIDVGADTSVDIVVYNTNTDGTDTIRNFDSGEDKYDTNFETDDGNFNEWVNLATNTTSSGGNVTITANEVDNDVFYYSGALGLDPTTATRNDVMVSLESALNSGADTLATNGSFSGVDASAEFLLVLHDTLGSETYVLEVETASSDSTLDLAEADLVGIFIGQNLVNGDII